MSSGTSRSARANNSSVLGTGSLAAGQPVLSGLAVSVIATHSFGRFWRPCARRAPTPSRDGQLRDCETTPQAAELSAKIFVASQGGGTFEVAVSAKRPVSDDWAGPGGSASRAHPLLGHPLLDPQSRLDHLD